MFCISTYLSRDELFSVIDLVKLKGYQPRQTTSLQRPDRAYSVHAPTISIGSQMHSEELKRHSE